MGRLIDADELMKRVEESRKENPHTDKLVAGTHNHEHYHFMTIIAGMPTAYDVDRVMEQIKELTNQMLTSEFCDKKSKVVVCCKKDCVECNAESLAEIVKEGGVE